MLTFNFIGIYLWHYHTYIECILFVHSSCHRVPPWRGYCHLMLGSRKTPLPSAWQQQQEEQARLCDPYRVLRSSDCSISQIWSVPTQAILGDQEPDNRINHISKAVMPSPKQTTSWTPALCINSCILSRWTGDSACTQPLESPPKLSSFLKGTFCK